MAPVLVHDLDVPFGDQDFTPIELVDQVSGQFEGTVAFPRRTEAMGRLDLELGYGELLGVEMLWQTATGELIDDAACVDRLLLDMSGFIEAGADVPGQAISVDVVARSLDDVRFQLFLEDSSDVEADDVSTGETRCDDVEVRAAYGRDAWTGSIRWVSEELGGFQSMATFDFRR